MPLVKRTVQTHAEPAKSTKTREHIVYVQPRHMTREDRKNLVPLDEISDAKLADLAARYPEEYGEEAQTRGLGETPADPALLELLAQPQKELFAAIRATKDLDVLAELENLESEGKGRAKVIAVIQQQMDAVEGEEEIDEEEED